MSGPPADVGEECAGDSVSLAQGPRLGNLMTQYADYTLAVDPIVEFGYLLVTVDMTGGSPTLTIEFRSQGTTRDSLTLDLASGQLGEGG